jgi:AcrR family transcriptional regulator
VSTQAPKRTVRTRRTGQEVRSRLIAAGRVVFSERGYAGASTKEIARRADVGEVLLFRHFGTKAGLFDVAVLDPFEEFVDDYARQWEQHNVRGETLEQMSRLYIEVLYGFLEENRQLVVALLSARAHHPTTAVRLDELFHRLDGIVRGGAVQYGLPSRDPMTSVRLTFGLVLSAAIHAELLFPAGPPMTRTEIIDELTRYMLHGIAHPR